MSIRYLDRLMQPRSIAVIGASDRAGSVGMTVWRNLRAGAFAGPIRAVNPKHQTLDGETVYARVSDLPQPPDLAVICTPPATLPGIVDELGQRGTRAAIIMTAGLDAAQKQASLAAARPHLLRLLGPNCLGLLTPRLGLNASFAHTDALAGDVAFVSQSGALLTTVLDWAKTRRIGFSHMISLGESLDVDFGDLLDYLARDARTHSILLYMESMASARKFMSAARAAARNKPVIVVKAGRAGNGVRAAASHTGALAGSDAVFDAAIRRAGMLRVETLQDLFVAAETLARFGTNRDEVMTILTNGGGAGVLAADAAGQAGVTLAELGPALQQRLDAILPATWSHGNPIDIIGDAPTRRYTEALQALLADRKAGAVLLLHAPTAIVRSDDIARACAPIVRQAPGRLMSCWLGDAAVAQARAIFEDAGAADYETPEEAVRAFAMLAIYRRNQALLLEAPTAGEAGPADAAAARKIIAAALAEGREQLGEFESKRILEAYSIPVVKTQLAAPDADAAAAAALAIGYPVVLKIHSPDISHKSDVGGVHLDLRGEEELRDAVAKMLARVHELQPEACIAGFAVQSMVARPEAQELIVGASVDPTFGPVVLFGHGGTAVEVLADRALALPPLNRILAADLVSRTRVARLLAGYRDHAPARLEAIQDVLVGLSQMLADLPELAELDINPLLADRDGVVALDARIRLSRLAPAGGANFAITPYPAELIEIVAWHDETIVLRPIRPEDEAQHLAFVERLQGQDLRLRYFNARHELARGELARLTQIDYAREMAFIAERKKADGTMETLGVSRVFIDPDNVEAELGIIIRSDLKTRGLGHLLLGKTIAFLRGRGTRRLVALVLRENTRMRELARSHGFAVDARASDPEALSMVLRLKEPQPECEPAPSLAV